MYKKQIYCKEKGLIKAWKNYLKFIQGKYLGIKPKSFCHNGNPGCYHKPVWIWIYNDNNEFLIQKRASCKKRSPNKWDMPSAGHTNSNETRIEGAIRETKEELGIEANKDEFKFLFEYIYDKNFEISEVYLLKCNMPIEEMTLAKEEVAEVKWVKYDELEKIIFSKEFTSLTKEYKDKILETLKALIK